MKVKLGNGVGKIYFVEFEDYMTINDATDFLPGALPSQKRFHSTLLLLSTEETIV